MARKKKDAPSAPGCPAWLATYGDMMTLVVTFFVLLFSMSSIDVEKWKALVMNLQGSNQIFSAIDNAGNVGQAGYQRAPEVPEDLFTDPSDEWSLIIEEMLGLAEDYNKENAQADQEDLVTVTYDDAQIVFRSTADVFFETRRADLLPDFYPFIHWFVDEVFMPKYESGDFSDLAIEGHADIRPLQGASAFVDNLGLSSARANAVQRYIMQEYGLPGDMISSIGWGEYHPLERSEDETNEEWWRKCRRVEFIMHRNFMLDTETGEGWEPED